jgi:alpha 1,2-mannosyltransferase
LPIAFLFFFFSLQARQQLDIDKLQVMSVEKSSLPQPKGRLGIRKILVYLLTAIVVHRVYLVFFTTPHRPKVHIVETSKLGYGQLYQESWQNLAKALSASRPSLASIGDFRPISGISVESVQESTSVDVIESSNNQIKSLSKSHKKFMKYINERQLSVIYQQNQQGVVITGNNDDLPNILIQLRLLRRTGSVLPVEVFLLAQGDYDAKYCKLILPKLNAQCKIVEEHIDAFPLPKLPESHQHRQIRANEPLHKYLAVFFSKFEQVLLLDPTTLVYNNPDEIIKEEPFLSTGLIFWPDFWASTVSPKLFAIQETPAHKRTKRDNIRTIDMGQFLISKSQHSATLLLSI